MTHGDDPKLSAESTSTGDVHLRHPATVTAHPELFRQFGEKKIDLIKTHESTRVTHLVVGLRVADDIVMNKRQDATQKDT